MIDLHIHSNYSDGTFSVFEILEKAQSANVTAISITDHNTIEAYHEIKNRRSLYTGRIIKGVEINCLFDGSKIEILGYCFEDDAFLQEWLNAHFSPQHELEFRRREYAK
ncbi:MAG TPA: PHP domain-containing protein [Clostridia bacterium]|nr:PHP domain-containing protein [Clostridia bacterium]